MTAPDASLPTTGAPRIVIVSASVAAGHDRAALALADRLTARGFAVDRHDFLDLMPQHTGTVLCGGYRKIITRIPSLYQWMYERSERTAGCGPVQTAVLRATERRMLAVIPPDAVAVLATYPLAARVLGRLRLTGRLQLPVATYLTDFSVHPLWIAPGVDLHLAHHELTAAQARGHGVGRVEATGPVVDPRFQPTTADRRTRARAAFGLPAHGPIALLVAGSWGVGPIGKAAVDVAATGTATPVVVCGQNTALAARLRKAGIEHVFGWVDDMPALMHASDVMVQNAGGFSSLEALASGLPVATYRSLQGHGRTNAAVLDAAGLAVWIREPESLAATLTDLIHGPLGRRQRAAGLALVAAGQSGAEEAVADLAKAVFPQAPDDNAETPSTAKIRIPAQATTDPILV